jgi:CheY-like chemotaxis protein
MAMKIVILEDNADRQRAMRAWLTDRFYSYEHRFFDDSGEMIRYLGDHLADTIVISLDHDLELKPGPHGRCLDPGSGREVADYLATQAPVCPVILQTTNAPAAAGMELVLREAGWKTRRVVPFDDLRWIETDWYPAIRRAIVGPTSRRPSPEAST